MMNNVKHTTINPETATVGEVVAQNYHAAGVFRQYGLDFCCGGGITIQAACEKHNLNTGEVVQELLNIPWETSTGEDNYQAWEPDFLIEHIKNTHHRFVRTKTDEIAIYAEKVARVHGERHPENVEIYKQFVHLAKDLLQHLESEEETVFPLILEVYEKRLSGQAVDDGLVEKLQKQLDLMVDDHEGAGSSIARIRELSHDFTPPEDACTTYRILYQNLEGFEKDLHKHVHLE
ncbi:MAG: iron-sulfur cluster repair di-iron protein, partial [Balneolaceae bacterium]